MTVINNVLSIEGKTASEAKDQDEASSFNSSVMRQFSRKWTLPAGCDGDKVSSNLSSDGILMVTAPKVEAIKHEGQAAIQ